MPLYHHTQIGYMVIIPFIIVIVILLVLPISNVPELFFPLIALGIIIILGLFATLTIEVTELHLNFWFGIGIFRKRILISDITSCKPDHIWMPNYGIHRTRRGWLYNVSGFKLVEITLQDGKRLLLGTNEVEDLCNAIMKAITISAKSIQHNIRSS
jgi:hypothetical protein